MNNALSKWDLVFESHLQLHRFSWPIIEATPYWFRIQVLGAQAVKFCKSIFARPLLASVDRCASKAEKHRWQRAAYWQSPLQVWDHSNDLSDHHVCTGYWAAPGYLILYHTVRSENNRYRKLLACRGCVKTLDHLFWECTTCLALDSEESISPIHTKKSMRRAPVDTYTVCTYFGWKV